METYTITVTAEELQTIRAALLEAIDTANNYHRDTPAEYRALKAVRNAKPNQ